MICWRVCDVVECFARNSDDVLRNCKVGGESVGVVEADWHFSEKPSSAPIVALCASAITCSNIDRTILK